LAGGPLIVAPVLSRIGRIGRVEWYMPASANVAVRDFGLAVTVAAVGLGAGPQIYKTVVSAIGLRRALQGMVATVVPVLLRGTGEEDGCYANAEAERCAVEAGWEACRHRIGGDGGAGDAREKLAIGRDGWRSGGEFQRIFARGERHGAFAV